MTRRRLYLAMLVGWIALLLTLTSIPDPDFGRGFPGMDKLAHSGFYGVAGFLCALWRRESGRGAKGAAVFAAVLVVLLGAADEIHQQWIPGRSMELLDWAADVAGGVAGALSSLAAVSLFPALLTPENQSAPRALTD
ncbi:MAG TPA: VanZ family protein [Candidatus Deferrimicrobiaceae bacterium]